MLNIRIVFRDCPTLSKDINALVSDVSEIFGRVILSSMYKSWRWSKVSDASMFGVVVHSAVRPLASIRHCGGNWRFRGRDAVMKDPRERALKYGDFRSLTDFAEDAGSA